MKGETPLLLVVMGVSGSGKSTMAKALGVELNLDMVDGDDLHSPESVAKMQAGIALDDADRWPWLDRIANYLGSAVAPNGPSHGKVVACSALKRAYRDRIRLSLPNVCFIFLDGNSNLIHSRMALRQGHFMHYEMLVSQLSTLERPESDETDVLTFNIGLPIDQLVKEAAIALENHRLAASINPLPAH